MEDTPRLVKDKAWVLIANKQGRRCDLRRMVLSMRCFQYTSRLAHLFPVGGGLLYGCAEEWSRTYPFTHFTARRNYIRASSLLLGANLHPATLSCHQSGLLPITMVCVARGVDHNINNSRRSGSLPFVIFN